MRASLLLVPVAATLLVIAACQPSSEPQATVEPSRAEASAPASTRAAGEPAAADAGAADKAARVFRATGNEPGWLAEVGVAGAGLRVEVDYGQTRYDVAAPSQGADGWAGSAADGTPIKLSIQHVPCQDAMSGQEFEAKAMLTVGARQLHGCGRFIAP